MKNLFKKMTLMALALTLALSAIACAAPSASASATLKAVYDALTAESSQYSQTKAMYAEYYEGVKLDVALEDNGITITQESSDEYVQSGKWSFVKDGDYLTITIPEDDYDGLSFAQNLLSAAAQAQGMNSTLLNAYISALSMTDKENKFFIHNTDEKAGTTEYRINIAGPYSVENLEGLNDLVLTEDVLQTADFGPLGEDWVSSAVNFGKVNVLVNGDKNTAKLLVMEYGDLDDLAYEDILQAVKAVQPKGWEDFVASWTELKDAETAGYKVILNPGTEEVQEIYEEVPEDYHCIIVSFGNTDSE